MTSRGIAARLSAVDWARVADALDAEGATVVPGLLSPDECATVVALYDREEGFRTRVVMSRHGYGRGEYKYFDHPLPALVSELRAAAYPPLVPIANRWSEALGRDVRFPATHAEFLERCHAAGQTRPTPLLLRYVQGDYNRLHQDLYGEHVFPLQIAVLLSAAGRDFTGGEFVMTEQRPRTQSRPMVVSLDLGDAVVFAVGDRPEPGPRGVRRVSMRHGVSKVRSGVRHALGIIFHDAT